MELWTAAPPAVVDKASERWSAGRLSKASYSRKLVSSEKYGPSTPPQMPGHGLWIATSGTAIERDF